MWLKKNNKHFLELFQNPEQIKLDNIEQLIFYTPNTIPDGVKNDLKNNKLSVGHARALLGLQNKTQMLAVADRIKNKRLNVRETEKLVSNVSKLSNKKSKKNKRNSSKSLNAIESKLIKKYGTKVSILFNKQNKGKITFEYYSKDDLQRILDLLIN